MFHVERQSVVGIGGRGEITTSSSDDLAELIGREWRFSEQLTQGDRGRQVELSDRESV
ncbi:MAG: hypothetical protein K2W85_09470 [Phycisphaerales bacterium]|nr:hypothetical protein [Phycisphaerales bacterium]